MPQVVRDVEAIIPYVDLAPRHLVVVGVDAVVRAMKRSDIEAMLALGRSLSDREILLLRMNLRRRGSIEEWVASIERGRRLTLVADVETAILGYISLSFRGLRWYRHLGDVRLVVHPEYRSLGFGSALVEDLVKLAQKIGLQRLVAQVPRSQKQARHFFQQHGFRQQVWLPEWVMDGEGKTQDLCLMARDLR